MESKRFSLGSIDWQKWANNSLLFLAPLLIIYIGYVINNINDGFSWKDFEMNSVITGTLMLYILNVVFDLLRKFVQDNSK